LPIDDGDRLLALDRVRLAPRFRERAQHLREPLLLDEGLPSVSVT
jgi:hypothetical protein